MKPIILSLFALFLIGTTAQAQQRLEKSIKVPNFVLTSATGDKVNLQATLKNNDRVLICFFRPVWCPICNKRTHELIERYDELKAKGIEVIAVYPANAEVMAQYVKDAEIPFPVIADPDENLYQLYSIERSMKKIQAAMSRDDFEAKVGAGTRLYQGKQYGKPSADKEAIINADFVLTNRRMVEVAYYGDYLGDHYDLDEL